MRERPYSRPRFVVRRAPPPFTREVRLATSRGLEVVNEVLDPIVIPPIRNMIVEMIGTNNPFPTPSQYYYKQSVARREAEDDVLDSLTDRLGQDPVSIISRFVNRSDITFDYFEDEDF